MTERDELRSNVEQLSGTTNIFGGIDFVSLLQGRRYILGYILFIFATLFILACVEACLNMYYVFEFA